MFVGVIIKNQSVLHCVSKTLHLSLAIIHGSITIIFGQHVTEKPENCVFSLKCCMNVTKNRPNTLKYHLITAQPPFTVKRLTGSTTHDLASILLSVRPWFNVKIKLF